MVFFEFLLSQAACEISLLSLVLVPNCSHTVFGTRNEIDAELRHVLEKRRVSSEGIFGVLLT